MPRIKVINKDEASDPLLKREYDAALKRAGRIWNIVSIMSQNAEAMKAAMAMYRVIMYGESPLNRAQREMLATVVSSLNQCLY